MFVRRLGTEEMLATLYSDPAPGTNQSVDLMQVLSFRIVLWVSESGFFKVLDRCR